MRGHQARTVPSSEPEKSRGPKAAGGGGGGAAAVPFAAAGEEPSSSSSLAFTAAGIFDLSTATRALTAAVWPVRQAAGLSESACQARICFVVVFFEERLKK